MHAHSSPLPTRTTCTPMQEFCEAQADTLKAHVRRCRRSHGSFFELRRTLETAHHFFAPRIITAVTAALLAFVLVTLIA